ncbi:pyridoxamine 5'-phosphate oxidase family protein [Methanimicrococcus sp. OttesenSCG-928-J09]|nr:pyridoxamine 5'-phosphate oxidase family protein [Methanimicrococcus sp. OttesenSCG-928-J09]
MQNRMKTHQLTEDEINHLLDNSIVGRLATVSAAGIPYVIPVHFVYNAESKKIYIHGLIRGQKLDNIAANPNVCFEADLFETFIMPPEDSPCDVNTQYQSVIITGTAKLLEDENEKADALNLIVEKYTPLLAGMPFGNAIKATAVIEISANEITGKYYKDEAAEKQEIVFE